MPALRRLIAIQNPCSGPQRDRLRHSRIGDALRDIASTNSGIEIEVHETKYRGHATEIARDIPLAAEDAVIAVGGDGTLHEVVNGLFTRKDGTIPTVGAIAAGTGNATCLDLGLSDSETAINAIAVGSTRAIDVATVTLDGKVVHAINIVGWGAFARINARAERFRWFGGARYTLAALCELLKPRIRNSGASLDGDREDPYLLGAACMTRYSGRGMRIAPHAILDDGYADLVLIRKGPRIVLAAILKNVFKGGHLSSPRVEYRRRDALQIELDEGSSIVVDGELLAARQVQIEVRCRALQVFAPPESP